ncbi:MAG: hypothetical protein QGI83_10930 [Candidatus Latescibacteria bacterium]|jgi:5-methyltetrahydrofolate--homocysteine methyltransferase|nr:hypothetical protein [Candidatus Latescibacterota bacterium]
MAIDFTPERWDDIRGDAARWWAGELKRPLIQARLKGHDPRRPEPELKAVHRTADYPAFVTPDEIVDRWDYELSCIRYLGDAFPACFPDFGPGVTAAFVGAHTVVADDTVWFLPGDVPHVSEMAFPYDEAEPWLVRIREIMEIGIDEWNGLVQIGMTDLGGNLDILSTFRAGSHLLLDLHDHPEEVKCKTWEAHEIWWRYFDELNETLQPVNPGYTAWTPIYSESLYYMLQCDVSYSVSPEMFDEFVRPELEATCKRLTNPFYHLDGPGALPHLDSLLAIDELKGIQWIPGEGNPDVTQWPEVWRKIRDAGKLIQFSGGINTFETIVRQLGSAEGIVFLFNTDVSREQEVLDFLWKYEAV